MKMRLFESKKLAIPAETEALVIAVTSANAFLTIERTQADKLTNIVLPAREIYEVREV